MYRNRKVLAMIPARGGSKGLPGKNIRPLLGKPLIAWTIEKAKSSIYFDEVFVSTDDEEIGCIAREKGANVPILRPPELAQDNTPMLAVVEHTLDYFRQQGRAFDYLASLEPTSPMRKGDDLDRAIAQLIDNEAKADSLVSVGEVHMENPEIVKRIVSGYVKPYMEIDRKVTRRQDLSAAYFPYGVIYLTKVETLLTEKTFYAERTIPFFIERWQNYEIDDLYDWLCIETILKYRAEMGMK